jgi:hypothetical protein
MHEGEFKDGEMHGKNGTTKYSNGDVYTGEFVAGTRHGKGEFTYANQDVYDGEWVKDNPREFFLRGEGQDGQICPS